MAYIKNSDSEYVKMMKSRFSEKSGLFCNHCNVELLYVKTGWVCPIGRPYKELRCPNCQNKRKKYLNNQI